MFKTSCSSIKRGSILIRFVVVVCVVALTFSAAWATQTYYASKVLKKKTACKFKVVDEKHPKRKMEVKIKKGAINDYLKQEKLKKVEITVEVEEELVSCQGDTHYHLKIIFGPTGAFFDPELKLTLSGDYVDTDCHVWLFDEDGNPVPGRISRSGKKITFFIEHFSTYYIPPS